MGQDIKANFKDVLGLITTTIAQTISDSKQSYSDSHVVIQDNENSTDCVNKVSIRDKTLYYVSSDVFNSASIYQSMVAQIAQALSDTQSTDSTGLFTGQQKEQFYATIADMIQTKLTSNTLAEIGQNATDVTVYVQKCNGSVGGKNVIISSQHNIYKYYDSLYNQNSVVQSVAADISNYISGQQAEKKTGILAVLMRMIALVIIGVIILAIVIVGAYLITLKGG